MDSLPFRHPDMRLLGGLPLVVVGGGVVGLSIATLAAQRGAQVRLYDPASLSDNASGVAAGMLSPALEALLDGGDGGRHTLFSRAYAAWPAFAAALGLPPLDAHAAGALYLAPAGELELMARRLERFGAVFQRLFPRAVRAAQPDLGEAAPEALRLMDDGRLYPRRILSAMSARLVEAGGVIVREPLDAPPAGDAAVVLAAGYASRRWARWAPELERLQPIKGHVLHYRGGPEAGATLRGACGYAAPQFGGLVFGATMEPGREDLQVEPGPVRALAEAAAALLPHLSHTPYVARTGVRAATPDGLPWVGRSAGGLHLATGARRNGWLLAPLIAVAAVEAIAGAPPEPAFDPARTLGPA